MRAARLWIIPLGLLLALLLLLSPGAVHAAGLTVSPPQGLPGATFQFDGSGFAPNEGVALWASFPDGSVRGQGTAAADSSGKVTFYITADASYGYGSYLEVAHGLSSRYELSANFGVYPAAPPPSSGGGGGGGSANACSATFYGAGFAPNESISTWAGRPDGTAVALPPTGADANGVVTFTVVPQFGWPGGAYTIVAHGNSTRYEVAVNLNFDGYSFTGGSCSPAVSGQPGPAPAPQPLPNLLLRNIVNYQGPGVYLNTDPTSLYYFDCNWKWRPMGGNVYMLAVGFQPYATVDVSYAILGLTGPAHYATIGADGSGNAGLSINTANFPAGHFHWFFSSGGTGYCGHYDTQTW